MERRRWLVSFKNTFCTGKLFDSKHGANISHRLSDNFNKGQRIKFAELKEN